MGMMHKLPEMLSPNYNTLIESLLKKLEDLDNDMEKDHENHLDQNQALGKNFKVELQKVLKDLPKDNPDVDELSDSVLKKVEEVMNHISENGKKKKNEVPIENLGDQFDSLMMNPPETNEEIQMVCDKVNENLLNMKANLSEMKNNEDENLEKEKELVDELIQLLNNLIQALPQEEQDNAEMQMLLKNLSDMKNSIDEAEKDQNINIENSHKFSDRLKKAFDDVIQQLRPNALDKQSNELVEKVNELHDKVDKMMEPNDLDSLFQKLQDCAGDTVNHYNTYIDENKNKTGDLKEKLETIAQGLPKDNPEIEKLKDTIEARLKEMEENSSKISEMESSVPVIEDLKKLR